MYSMTTWGRLSTVLAILFACHTPLQAIGGANIGNEVPSARAAGQGYVGIAGQNNDPTAAYSNPAAMTSLKGTQATFGGTYEHYQGSFETDAGASEKSRPTNVFIPNMSVTHSWMEGKFGAGLSVQSPFGLETHWTDTSSLRYVATNSRLNMVLISPAVAYKLHEMISFGIGADYANVFNAQLDRRVQVDAVNTALGFPSSGSEDAVSSLKGQGNDWGYHAGLTIQPHEQHSIGAVYRSRIAVRLTGQVALTGLSGASAAVFGGGRYETSAYTDVNLPETFQLGYAWKPNSKIHWEANAGWFRWSKAKDLRVRFAETDATRLAVLNTGNPTAFDFRDAWSFATGLNYAANDKWQYRGGFFYEPWAQPESTYSPAFLDLSRYGLTGGLGHALTKNLSIDAAYVAVFMKKRVVHNSVGYATTGNPAVDVDGTYGNFAHLISANLTYRFGSSN